MDTLAIIFIGYIAVGVYLFIGTLVADKLVGSYGTQGEWIFVTTLWVPMLWFAIVALPVVVMVDTGRFVYEKIAERR